jgi:hypothetical protein
VGPAHPSIVMILPSFFVKDKPIIRECKRSDDKKVMLRKIALNMRKR